MDGAKRGAALGAAKQQKRDCGDKIGKRPKEVRGGGRQELPHAPNPRPGVAARRSCPTSKEQWLCRPRRT